MLCGKDNRKRRLRVQGVAVLILNRRKETFSLRGWQLTFVLSQ